MATKPIDLVKLYSKLAIRFAPYGCSNRPFYQIVVAPVKKAQRDQPIEVIGNYDPMPNEHNEKLFSINLERMKYWLAQDTEVSEPVLRLLGLAGYFPISPKAYMKAWRSRFRLKEEAEKAAAAAAAEASKAKTEESVQT
ncbi:37S ribosomal protein S16, mitochondrial [Chamberlinius hualienensis]